MQKANKTWIFLAALLVFHETGRGQGGGFLHSMVLGSGGNAALRVAFDESGLSEVHSSLVKALGMRAKSQMTLSASAASRESLFGRFAATYGNSDSTDLFVGVCVAGWHADSQRPESFHVAGMHPDTVKAEYLLLFLRFLPTHNAVVFLLAPSKAEFPLEIIKTTATGGGGGKYVVFVKTKERITFEDLVEEFIETFEDAKGMKEADANTDGYVSFSEWLEELSVICRESKISLLPYKVEDGEDMKIKRVQ